MRNGLLGNNFSQPSPDRGPVIEPHLKQFGCLNDEKVEYLLIGGILAIVCEDIKVLEMALAKNF